MMWKNLLLIFVGGGVGSVARSLIGRWVNTVSFPYATLLVNVLGCFLIGLLYALFSRQLLNSDVRMLMVVGFCGGFTTFSTFSIESLHLLRSGQMGAFALNVIASLVCCLLAVGLGDYLGRQI